jgi:hypothetical protein
MSVQQRRKYDPEFKRNTEEPGRTVTGVAENLGYQKIFFIGGDERNM